MSDSTPGSVGAWASGTVEREPKCAASSRATPTMHIASGRFGVIERSKITSSSAEQPRARRRPSSAASSSCEDARVVVAETQLVGREEHAVGLDAADLPALERPDPGSRRTGGRVRHDVAGGHVARAADDTWSEPLP